MSETPREIGGNIPQMQAGCQRQLSWPQSFGPGTECSYFIASIMAYSFDVSVTST